MIKIDYDAVVGILTFYLGTVIVPTVLIIYFITKLHIKRYY